jgi:hypothetical protein
MPFSPNLLWFPQIGPRNLIDGPDQSNAALQIGLTVISGAFASVLIFTLICSLQRTLVMATHIWRVRSHSAAYRITACAFTVAAAGISFAWAVFHTTIANLDRYFLLPIALVTPCALLGTRWLRISVLQKSTILIAALIACYSTASEHDYMSMNRARWQALSDLDRAGVTSDQIDGGVEFNYASDPSLSNDLILGPGTFESIHRGTGAAAQMRGWSIHGDQYIISLCPVDGYDVKAVYKYWSALELKQKDVLCLVRQPRQ